MSNREIQKIFQAFEPQLNASRQPLKNRKAIGSLTRCRTERMGYSYYTCGNNRHEGITCYHSCRHRSCYLCAQQKRLEWVEAQKERLFNTPHFHVVFTLPHEYLSLWRYNEALFTKIIFKASQQTLFELIESEHHWHVTPGVLMTLHTWGRQLGLHPHTHCLVTAGGLNAQGEWVEMNDFLLPSPVLRQVYRGKLQSFLKEAFEDGELALPEGMCAAEFWRIYRSLYRKEWSVRVQQRYDYAKGVALYLARYCKGGPLNPKQIRACDDRGIEMSYLDHRDKRIKRQRLKPMAFMRLLLQHVPPEGVHTIRYYGLYSPAAKAKHQSVAQEFGVLADHPKAARVDLQSMVICCKQCGAPAKLKYRWYNRKKGNSINKEAPGPKQGSSVQQGDDTNIANVPKGGSPVFSSG